MKFRTGSGAVSYHLSEITGLVWRRGSDRRRARESADAGFRPRLHACAACIEESAYFCEMVSYHLAQITGQIAGRRVSGRVGVPPAMARVPRGTRRMIPGVPYTGDLRVYSRGTRNTAVESSPAEGCPQGERSEANAHPTRCTPSSFSSHLSSYFQKLVSVPKGRILTQRRRVNREFRRGISIVPLRASHTIFRK